MVSSSPVEALYVHVPFCARKCAYCAFYSEASDGALINRYVAALNRELEMVAGGLRPRTVFFGGGTPSLLNLRQWESVFACMDRSGLMGAEEWTIECNPATVSLDKARCWREHGVNRVSMGVQSLDEGLLDRLGRIHSRDQVFRSFEIFRAAGFDNVNLDLMFAIPGQTMVQWQSTLAEATALGSEHLACYEVIYEEDTALYAQLKAGEFSVDEDLACAMYEELITAATGAGYRQYEVANFARAAGAGVGELPGRACRHNVNYWRGGAFHGLGPSASGYVGGVRTRNWSSTQRYCELLEQGQRAVESREQLEPVARAGEIAAFGLRMNLGWSFAEFARVTGMSLEEEWAGNLADLVQSGWGERFDGGFRLTGEGLRFADAAGAEFLRTPAELAAVA